LLLLLLGSCAHLLLLLLLGSAGLVRRLLLLLLLLLLLWQPLQGTLKARYKGTEGRHAAEAYCCCGVLRGALWGTHAAAGVTWSHVKTQGCDQSSSVDVCWPS
jgi:hypothetical protein